MINFCIGLIIGGLLIGLFFWRLLWLIAHPGSLADSKFERCLDKIEKWAERQTKKKFEKVSKHYE